MDPVKIDHILLGISDLKKGIADFETLTGVRPEFGGVHPNIGTHNALISLGNGSYLEIIAPQEKNKKLTGPFRGFEDLDNLGSVGWALQTDNIQGIINQLDKLHIAHSGKISGSRMTPDDKTLRWSTTFLIDIDTTSIQPFFIQWEQLNLHPSLATPQGCTLASYSFVKEDDPLGNFLGNFAIGDSIDKKEGYTSGMITNVVLDTPKGLVRFE